MVIDNLYCVYMNTDLLEVKNVYYYIHLVIHSFQNNIILPTCTFHVAKNIFYSGCRVRHHQYSTLWFLAKMQLVVSFQLDQFLSRHQPSPQLHNKITQLKVCLLLKKPLLQYNKVNFCIWVF